MPQGSTIAILIFDEANVVICSANTLLPAEEIQLKNKLKIIHQLQTIILEYAEEVPWLRPIYYD